LDEALHQSQRLTGHLDSAWRRDGGLAGRRMFATLLPTKRVGAKYLVLTHLIPMIGADCHGIWKIPGGALSEAEYRKVVQDSGFTGSTVFRCP